LMPHLCPPHTFASNPLTPYYLVRQHRVILKILISSQSNALVKKKAS
jgi:hypothetical protein